MSCKKKRIRRRKNGLLLLLLLLHSWEEQKPVLWCYSLVSSWVNILYVQWKEQYFVLLSCTSRVKEYISLACTGTNVGFHRVGNLKVWDCF